MTKHIATIKDVAAHANVSTATVSNVIRGKDTFYGADTARLVWQAVHTLGYRPNRVARSLVCRRTDTLGVVIDRPHGRLPRNAYMNGLLDGFLEYAVEAGYQIKLVSLLVADREGAVSHLEDGSMDGIALFAPPEDSPLLLWAQTTRVPIVVAGSTSPTLKCPGVDLDDADAAYKAVCWLIEQGHTRIGLVTGPSAQWSALRREAGYRRAMQEAGLEAPACWCYAADYSPHSGEEGTRALLELRPRLTALVCWNDGMAIGAMKVARQCGLRLPEDISILGFDDAEAGIWVQPALTTVQQPVSEMGAKAAELLIRQVVTGNREGAVTLFPGKLIVRQSVAAPGGAM